jgi:hypothetical protein
VVRFGNQPETINPLIPALLKKRNLPFACETITLVSLLLTLSLHAQISFQELYSQGEGAAAWDADGSGPEPYGNGHSTYSYYAASRDYVDPSSSAGAHVTVIGNDFPLFVQALADNGFTPDQVKLTMGLASLGNDLEGEDWFSFETEDYLNFYPLKITLYLNEELMISGFTGYVVFKYGVSTGY